MIETPQWRKSSRSGGGAQCVEVALNVPGAALIRDSKLGDGSPILDPTTTGFGAFLAAVKAGRFDAS